MSGVNKVTEKISRDNPSCHKMIKLLIVLGDRKYEVVTTPFSEKKSLTRDVEECTDKLVDTTLMEKKYFTKDVEEGTYKLPDMTFMEKKFSTKDV